jgi:hypothetical protein
VIISPFKKDMALPNSNEIGRLVLEKNLKKDCILTLLLDILPNYGDA